jgi:ATP-dependent Clp protease ATP-binding subunit ClpA
MAVTDIGLTPSAAALTDLARQEALKRGHRYIGTEHILLAILRQDRVAAGVLQSLGVTYENASKAIDFVLGREPVPGHDHTTGDFLDDDTCDPYAATTSDRLQAARWAVSHALQNAPFQGDFADLLAEALAEIDRALAATLPADEEHA